jgi:hypothetical protein
MPVGPWPGQTNRVRPSRSRRYRPARVLTQSAPCRSSIRATIPRELQEGSHVEVHRRAAGSASTRSKAVPDFASRIDIQAANDFFAVEAGFFEAISAAAGWVKTFMGARAELSFGNTASRSAFQLRLQAPVASGSGVQDSALLRLRESVAAYRDIHAIESRRNLGASLFEIEGEFVGRPTIKISRPFSEIPVLQATKEGGYLRTADSEFQLAQEFVSTHPTSIRGTLHIYTERLACASCSKLPQQIREIFPNVRVNLYSGPHYGTPSHIYGQGRF